MPIPSLSSLTGNCNATWMSAEHLMRWGNSICLSVHHGNLQLWLPNEWNRGYYPELVFSHKTQLNVWGNWVIFQKLGCARSLCRVVGTALLAVCIHFPPFWYFILCHMAVSIRDVGAQSYSYFPSAPPDHTQCGAKGGGAMSYSTIKDKPSLKTIRAPSSHKLLSMAVCCWFSFWSTLFLNRLFPFNAQQVCCAERR